MRRKQQINRPTDQPIRNIKQKADNSNFVILTEPALSEVERAEKSGTFSNPYMYAQTNMLFKNTFFKFIKEAFSSKRKQMLGNLKSFPKDKVKELLIELGKD